jgi:translation elongation factor EF-1beta
MYEKLLAAVTESMPRAAVAHKREYEPLAFGLVVLVITLAGFWPTFYGAPASEGNDLLHMLHGVSATLWIVLFLAQSWFTGYTNRRLHQWLGWSSVAVASVLIPSSLAMVHLMFAQALSPLFLVLGFIDLTTLPLFLGLYIAALVNRRRPQIHWRLMASTLVVGVIPAAARFFRHYMHHSFPSLGDALLPSYLLVYCMLLVTILFDWRKGRLLWPFPFTLAYYAVIQLTMAAGGHSTGFRYIARSLAYLR